MLAMMEIRLGTIGSLILQGSRDTQVFMMAAIGTAYCNLGSIV
jgi:hypothetical protein